MADTEYQKLKGDPDKVITYGTKYQNIGDAIARSVTVLNKIAAGDAGKSKAIEALKKKAGDVAKDIDQAKDRYQQTADALLVYGPKLRDAQDKADQAIAQIGQKQDDVSSAQRTASDAQHTADTAADADKADAAAKAKTASDAVDQAQHDLKTAQDAWHAAEDAKNTAATDAVNAIHEVIYGDHAIKDGWWDNWGSKAFAIFKAVCKWASILSVFLSWVPILGEVLLALAAIGAIIDVIDSIVKAVNGDGSWWGVLGAVAGLALTVVGGGAAARLAKSFKATAFLKIAPKLGERVAGRNVIGKIVGEDAVKAVMRGEKRLSQRGLQRMITKEGEQVLTRGNVKGELVKAAKTKLQSTLWAGKEGTHITRLRDLKKFDIDSFAKLKSDGLKTVFEKGVLPDLRHPVKALKDTAGLGGTFDDLSQGVRLLAKNPHVLLEDPKAAVHLAVTGGLAGSYQGYESYKALHGHWDNISQGKWLDEGLSFVKGGDEVKTIVENAKSLEFKNQG